MTNQTSVAEKLNRTNKTGVKYNIICIELH